MPRLSFDIFCRVIDNFGDIGVCWRLAKQLAIDGQTEVRLWVDDLLSFNKIEPRVDPHLARQDRQGVDIVQWSIAPPDLEPLEVVIEAFACDPPDAFKHRMVERNSLWINLEYLSAEPWVESFHALPSLQNNGVRKAFFFPGFTPQTGGLLREPDLLSARDQWLSDPALRVALLRELGLPTEQLRILAAGARQVFLFGYPSAPARVFTQSLQDLPEPTVILVPAGICPDLERGTSGRVHVHEIPFVDQDRLDRVLWSSDLNCVRGEDTLVRALWAGKPMLWQIYPQADDAHLRKLEHWLALSPYPTQARHLIRTWNTGPAAAVPEAVHIALQEEAWAQWQASCAQWSRELTWQTDLATALVAFCTLDRRKG